MSRLEQEIIDLCESGNVDKSELDKLLEMLKAGQLAQARKKVSSLRQGSATENTFMSLAGGYDPEAESPTARQLERRIMDLSEVGNLTVDQVSELHGLMGTDVYTAEARLNKMLGAPLGDRDEPERPPREPDRIRRGPLLRREGQGAGADRRGGERPGGRTRGEGRELNQPNGAATMDTKNPRFQRFAGMYEAMTKVAAGVTAAGFDFRSVAKECPTVVDLLVAFTAASEAVLGVAELPDSLRAKLPPMIGFLARLLEEIDNGK